MSTTQDVVYKTVLVEHSIQATLLCAAQFVDFDALDAITEATLACLLDRLKVGYLKGRAIQARAEDLRPLVDGATMERALRNLRSQGPLPPISIEQERRADASAEDFIRRMDLAGRAS